MSRLASRDYRVPRRGIRRVLQVRKPDVVIKKKNLTGNPGLRVLKAALPEGAVESLCVTFFISYVSGKLTQTS